MLAGEERRRVDDDDPSIDPPVLERRRIPDRRGGTIEGSRIRIPQGLSRGWLAFESEHDKRRFAPIPVGWEEMSDEALESLCVRATQAPARRRPTE